MSALLSVENLSVSFDTPDGVVHAVNDVSFSLETGKTLGVVGESGSGKSVATSSILRLNSSVNASTSGRIMLNGTDMLNCSDAELRARRGSEVAMVFQDPLSALNPYFTVGHQIAEAYKVHHPDATKGEVRDRVMDMLTKVGIPHPELRIDEYPHQFSGGMRQRIVIAIALVNSPKLLIADEPTTALDVTVQAQIIDLMMSLQAENNMSIILITHDLGVVAEVAQEVVVMYGGRIVEDASVRSLFNEPIHPYSWGLLGAVGSFDKSKRGELKTITGTPPSLISLPQGCAFAPRCEYASQVGQQCLSSVPELRSVGSYSSRTACHMADEQIIELSKKART